MNLLYDPERRIEVEWDKGADVSPYTVRLTIQVEDRKGILADVSAKIAGINTNIRNVEATVDDQIGPHRHDGRDQRHEAPAEGDQVAAERRGRGGCRAGSRLRSITRNVKRASHDDCMEP